MATVETLDDHRRPADDPRAALRALLEAQGWSMKEAAGRIGLSDAAVGAWLREEYRGNNARVEKLVRRFLATERDVSAMRAGGLDRHADLAVTEQVSLVAAHAHANRDLAAVYGAAGAGKSWALQRYCNQHSGAWYASMSPAITTPTSVLARIAGALDVAVTRATAAQLERVVIDRLSGGQVLLVVDEAHHLTQGLLDVVRCVYDAAGCGLVLAGNEPLWSRLASGDRAAQLVSRVGIARHLRKPVAADILALAETLLGRPAEGAGRDAVLAVGRGVGGLRAVRKIIAQAQILARGDGRDKAATQDLADAALLLKS